VFWGVHNVLQVEDCHTECHDRETKSRLRTLRGDTKTGHDMQDEKHQDGLVTPPARSTMRARCLSHTAGKCPRAFRSFRASFIGINNITAGKALGLAVAFFLSSSNRAFLAFFRQPGQSEVCGLSFSFVALGSAFTASVRNGPGLYTLAKGVSSVVDGWCEYFKRRRPYLAALRCIFCLVRRLL
jgi:hypothetical protein